MPTDSFIGQIGMGVIPAVWYDGNMLGVLDDDFDPDHRRRQLKMFGEEITVRSAGENGSVYHYDVRP